MRLLRRIIVTVLGASAQHSLAQFSQLRLLYILIFKYISSLKQIYLYNKCAVFKKFAGDAHYN